MPDIFGFLYGDVVGSAGIGRRVVFGMKLERACREVNERFAKTIYAPAKVYRGIDELGAILKSPAEAYRIVDFIGDFVYPDRVRFVLVFGPIDRALASRDVARMDGPAFHDASKAMLALKRDRLLFALKTGHHDLDRAIAGEISLLLMLKSTWSERQRQVARLYGERATQKAVARKLRVTQQAVSGALTRASWQAMDNLERQVDETLVAIGHELVRKEASDAG